MSELRELYQTTILDHSRQPKNFGKLDECTHKAEGYNPLCGDKVTVYLEIDGDHVKDIRFDGAGCAISTASASPIDCTTIRSSSPAASSSGSPSPAPTPGSR